MKPKSYLLSIIIILLLALCGDLISQPLGAYESRIRFLKEALNFSEWPTISGKVRSAIVIGPENFSYLEDLKLIEPENQFRIERINDSQLIEIRKGWTSGKNYLNSVLITAKTSEAAREHMIFRYANTQAEPPNVKRMSEDFGLKIGDVCLVVPDDSTGESFSSIDFVRDNVLVMLNASGNTRSKLRLFAESVDSMLQKTGSAESYNDLPDLPVIETLSIKEVEIPLYKKVHLRVEIKNPGNNKLNYYWEVTGGGVEKDLLDRFYYYAGDQGSHQIQLTVINDLGLFDTKTINLEVSKE